MKTVRLLLFVSTWLSIVGSCLWLGVWQMQRLEWKTRWIASIDAAYQGDIESPRPFVPAELFPPYHDSTSFYRGRIQGSMYDLTSYLIGPRTYNGKVGWHWYALLKINESESIWVDRGFVPEDFVPQQITNAQVTITGSLRPPEYVGVAKQLIQMPDTTGKRESRWLDAGAYNERTLTASGNVSPFILHAETATSYDPALVLLKDRPVLRNEHLNYAIFWFIMAAISAVFGAISLRQRLASANQQG